MLPSASLMALVRTDGHTKIVDDPLGKALDVIGVNEYIGWYEAHPETADITQWNIAYDKPLIHEPASRTLLSRMRRDVFPGVAP